MSAETTAQAAAKAHDDGVHDAYESGRGMGAGLALVLVLAGLSKCLQIMLRPSAQKLGVISLALLLSGWLVSAIGQMLHAEPSSMLWFGLLDAALILAAFVTAIVSLATYDRARFAQGRSQAIWALVLSSIALVAGVSVFVMKSARRTPDSQTAAATVVNKDFNFAIDLPAGWAKMKAEVFNKDAVLAYVHTHPEIYFVVIAERDADETDMAAATEIVKGRLAAAGKVLQQQESKQRLGDLEFTRVVSRVHLADKNLNISYEHWLLMKQGFFWQIVFWSGENGSDEVKDQARRIAGAFRILDLDAHGGSEVHDVRQPAWGYATHLSGQNWQDWKSKESGNVLVDFRASRSNEAVEIVPIRFDADTPPPDMVALSRAMQHFFHFDAKSASEIRQKPFDTPVGEGLEIERDAVVSQVPYTYVIRVLRGKDHAYMTAGWAVSHGDLKRVRAALDSIDFFEPIGKIPERAAAEKSAYALFLNELGISYHDRKDYAAAAKYFERAALMNPQDAVLLENLARADSDGKAYDKALAFIAPRIGAFRDNFELRALQARLHASAGHGDAAVKAFKAMLDDGLKDEDELFKWLEFLHGLPMNAQAQQSAADWVAKYPSVNSRRWYASTMAQNDNPQKALQLLADLAKEFPQDMRVRYSLGEAANRAGEHAKAESIAREFLAGNSKDVRALRMLGWSQMGSKRARDAKATFEAALQLRPDDTDLEEDLRDAAAAAGKSESYRAKTPIQAVAMPADLAQTLRKEAAAPVAAGQAVHVFERTTGISFEPGKPLRRTLRRRALVANQDGARELSLLQVAFEPLAERIYINRVEVKDAKGNVLAKVHPDDAYITDAGEDSASNRKTLNLPIPGLVPGAVIESEITLEELDPASRLRFSRHLFAHAYPTAVEAVYITGKLDSVHAESSQTSRLRKQEGDRYKAWIADNLAAAKAESYAVPIEEREPMLWLGGDEGDWSKVAGDYLKQIDDRLKPDAEAVALAAKLTAGQTENRDKIATLARYVQQHITYKALEFGVRASRPNAAHETLQQRFGDCKDHALLLFQMLRAAGVPASMALVNTEYAVRPELPSLDQFNHMVVLVPELGKDWLIDTTDKDLALSAYPADGLWNSRALVLDPAAPELIPPRSGAAPPSTVVSKRVARADGDDWKIEETVSLNGYYGSWMRRALAGLDAHHRDAKIQELLAQHAAAELSELRVAEMDDAAKPLLMTLTYRVRNAVKAGDVRATAVLPALWEREYLGTSFVKDRQSDFNLHYPLHLSSELVVKVPVAAADVAAMTAKKSGGFVSWQMDSEVAADGDLKVRFEFDGKPGRFAAATYAAFHEDWEAASRAWDIPLSWRRQN